MIEHRSPAAIVTFLMTFALAVLATACSEVPLSPSALGTGGATSPGLSQRAGDGNTPSRLTQAGWHRLNVPGHGVHCEDPHAEIGSSVHIQVKVFDTSDIGSDSAPFLGTESLVREDHYRGQPCLPGHGEYFL